MSITFTPISKSANITLSTVSKTSGTGAVSTGNPIGLLLALTYASAVAGTDGITLTLISKN